MLLRAQPSAAAFACSSDPQSGAGGHGARGCGGRPSSILCRSGLWTEWHSLQRMTFHLIGVQSQCSYHGLKCKHSSLGTILRSQARQNQEAGVSGFCVLVRRPAPPALSRREPVPGSALGGGTRVAWDTLVACSVIRRQLSLDP